MQLQRGLLAWSGFQKQRVVRTQSQAGLQIEGRFDRLRRLLVADDAKAAGFLIFEPQRAARASGQCEGWGKHKVFEGVIEVGLQRPAARVKHLIDNQVQVAEGLGQTECKTVGREKDLEAVARFQRRARKSNK